ncbi:MAG TPA: helix-turn-helix transcriptional regulator [Streptosporangiaceae bacterium]|nr:helix-turn-helix transcriptional regulator [Streptosporangiaceae bacterium]
MTIPPSAPGRASRAALIARLTELREAAGLSENALAGRMGVVQSRVWKITHGQLLPNEDDLAAWAEATSHPDAAGELAEMLKAARGEQTFGALLRKKGGAAAYEERIRAIETQSQRIGEFAAAVVPGIVQTADYARELMSVASGPRAWGSDDTDVEDKINSRLRRQEILYDSSKRVQVIIHEAALRVLVTTPGTMAGQLDKLLAVSRLHAVEFGVIPFSLRMPAYPLGFRVYDDSLIIVESTVEEKDYTAEANPKEVETFLGAFEALRQAAVTDDEARRLITAAAGALQDGDH